MKKLMSLTAFGLGYMLGSRAGRERYDQLMNGFLRVREDPRVQEQAQHVADVAKEQAPAVVDKVTGVASAAVQKVRPSSDTQDQEERGEVAEEGADMPQGLYLPSSA